MYDIPLVKPLITEGLKRRVLDVLDSGYLTEGPVTREFESGIAEFCGVPYGIALTSCTTGLELALRALGIGPGDEVIAPDYTYPATAMAVMAVGAVAVIVDVDPETMLIDCDALESAVTDKTKGAVPVSLFGNPLDWDRLNEIKERHGLFMIEDAACALGSEYKGRKTGAWADISVFSHHPRKFITTGEGGTVTTANKEWAEWINSYKHFGMIQDNTRRDTQFVRAGMNYKLSNVLAAIGLEQLRHIEELLAERRNLAGRYFDLLAGDGKIGLPKITDGGEHSYQTFGVFVEERDRIMAELRAGGIEAQIGTYALHMHEAFQGRPLCRIMGDMKGSRYAFDHALALPFFNGMTEGQQIEVIQAR